MINSLIFFAEPFCYSSLFGNLPLVSRGDSGQGLLLNSCRPYCSQFATLPKDDHSTLSEKICCILLLRRSNYLTQRFESLFVEPPWHQLHEDKAAAFFNGGFYAKSKNGEKGNTCSVAVAILAFWQIYHLSFVLQGVLYVCWIFCTLVLFCILIAIQEKNKVSKIPLCFRMQVTWNLSNQEVRKVH